MEEEAEVVLRHFDKGQAWLGNFVPSTLIRYTAARKRRTNRRSDLYREWAMVGLQCRTHRPIRSLSLLSLVVLPCSAPPLTELAHSRNLVAPLNLSMKRRIDTQLRKKLWHTSKGL